MIVNEQRIPPTMADMNKSEETNGNQPQSCGKGCPCRRCSDPPESLCGGCGRCCGKTIEYVVIDSFVWPPWPEKEDEKS